MKLTYLNNLKYFVIENLNEIYYFVIAEKVPERRSGQFRLKKALVLRLNK